MRRFQDICERFLGEADPVEINGLIRLCEQAVAQATQDREPSDHVRIVQCKRCGKHHYPTCNVAKVSHEDFKEPTNQGPVIRVKRIGPGCCGMEQWQEYEARGSVDSYVSVKLPDGTWTDDHFAPNFFAASAQEVLKDGE